MTGHGGAFPPLGAQFPFQVRNGGKAPPMHFSFSPFHQPLHVKCGSNTLSFLHKLVPFMMEEGDDEG
jgi:hypothetical protein